MDDEDAEEWSLPPHDIGSINQLTEGRMPRKKAAKPEPVGFVDFSRQDYGVRIIKEWTPEPPQKKPRSISLPVRKARRRTKGRAKK